MISADNGNWRKFQLEDQKKENMEFQKREIRQIGNHEEGIQGKLIFRRGEIGEKGICKNTKWKKEKLARVQTWKIRNFKKGFWGKIDKDKLGWKCHTRDLRRDCQQKNYGWGQT